MMLIEKRGRVATLPNCDGCGRFTSSPTARSWCTGGNNLGWHACYSELLCPRCVDKREGAEVAP